MDKFFIFFLFLAGLIIISIASGFYIEWLSSKKGARGLSGEVTAIVLISSSITFILGMIMS